MTATADPSRPEPACPHPSGPIPRRLVRAPGPRDVRTSGTCSLETALERRPRIALIGSEDGEAVAELVCFQRGTGRPGSGWIAWPVPWPATSAEPVADAPTPPPSGAAVPAGPGTVLVSDLTGRDGAGAGSAATLLTQRWPRAAHVVAARRDATSALLELGFFVTPVFVEPERFDPLTLEGTLAGEAPAASGSPKRRPDGEPAWWPCRACAPAWPAFRRTAQGWAEQASAAAAAGGPGQALGRLAELAERDPVLAALAAALWVGSGPERWTARRDRAPEPWPDQPPSPRSRRSSWQHALPALLAAVSTALEGGGPALVPALRVATELRRLQLLRADDLTVPLAGVDARLGRPEDSGRPWLLLADEDLARLGDPRLPAGPATDLLPVPSGTLVSRTPVTVAQYEDFLRCACGGAQRERDRASGRDRAPALDPPAGWALQRCHPGRPVTGVSWHAAAGYCRWLAARTGRAVQLPTAAVLEEASGLDAGCTHPWGTTAPDGSRANYDQHLGCTSPVLSYPRGAGPYGHLDLSGNVWEWCRNRDGDAAVVHGGGWYSRAPYVTSAYRFAFHVDNAFHDLGFRVACPAARPAR